MPGVHNTPVSDLPTRAPKPSGNPRQQPASLHRGASHQHPPWGMTEGQPVCEKPGDAPGNAGGDGMAKSLHGVVLLRSYTGTATHSRSSECRVTRTTYEVVLPASTGMPVNDYYLNYEVQVASDVLLLLRSHTGTAADSRSSGCRMDRAIIEV